MPRALRRYLTALAIALPLVAVVGFTPAATQQQPLHSRTTQSLGAALASDDFDRQTSAGWGNAPTGGAWTVSGDQGRASVDGGDSEFAMPASLTQRAELRSVSSSRTRVTTQFSVDKLFQGTGEGYYVAATARQVGQDGYSGRIVVSSDGTARLYLLRNFVNLATSVEVANLKITPGVDYSLSVEAIGTSPTVVSAKVWPSSGAEPSQWQLRGADTHAALQRPGHVGVFVYMPGAARNVPVTTSFESFLAEDPSATPAPAPVPAPTPSSPNPSLGPVSFPSIEAMKASGKFRIPRDANLVMWSHGNKTLEEVLGTLGGNDILVLPERSQPYLIDSSGGFRAAGVGSIAGQGGKRIPVTSTFQGRDARTWFAMARAQRGIIGLGPGAVIATTDSGFRQEAQIEDKGSPLVGGGTSPGRYWWNTSGVKQYELAGAQEKLIETAHSNAYFANFGLRGRDFGGVAYSAISMPGGTLERLNLNGAWRGFQAVPNGETAAIAINGGRYLISRVAIGPLDEQGRRVGSSPVMVNNSPGGRWEYGDVSQTRVGMPTIWRSSGRHEWYEVSSRWGGGHGVNIEAAKDGFEFVMTGGRLWPNRGGRGGNPSPDGIHGNGLHLALHATGRATIALNNVDLDSNVQAGKLNVQLYNGTDPSKVRASVTNGGIAVPIAAYGPSGLVNFTG